MFLNQKTFPQGYILLSIAGFLGATVLCFFKDGHAPSLLAGGILSLAMHRSRRVLFGEKKSAYFEIKESV